MIGKAAGTMAAEWPTLLAQSFLLQAWVPHFTENALQMHCWFLSCLAAKLHSGVAGRSLVLGLRSSLFVYIYIYIASFI